MTGDITTSNTETGSQSTNTNTVVANTTNSVDVSQNASINNSATFNVVTGDNTVSNNTTVAGVQSGSVQITPSFTTVANADSGAMAAAVSALTAPDTIHVNSSNTDTGANSTNSNPVSLTNSSTSSVTNTSTISNTVSANIVTGGNTVNGNTKVGLVKSGDVTIGFNVTNTANSPVPVYTGVGGGTPTPIVTPVTTPVFTGMGGDFPPIAILTSATTPATPVYSGVGGGYFPAGSNAFIPELALFALVSAAVVFAKPLRQFVQAHLPRHRSF